MRLIDADELIKKYKTQAAEDWNQNAAPPSWSYALNEIVDDLEDAPTVDAVPAVRERDCKYAYESSPGLLYCHHPNCKRHLYCAADELHICGERKEPE